MKSHRRDLMTPLVRRLVISSTLLLAACGDGGQSPSTAEPPSISAFTSDRASYFVGERAQLSAVFANGGGRIQPGDIAIASGQTITTPALTVNTTYRLTVTGTGSVAARELALGVSYRERMRAITMPFARTQHAAVTLNDGRVLIVGGVDESRLVARLMYVFDPSSEEFTSFGSLGSAGPFASVAVTLADGNVLIAGGVPASASSNAVLVNAQTGAVAPTTGQPRSQRVLATGSRLADGKVLIVGGLLATTDTGGNVIGVSTTPDRTAETYDPATGTFTALPGSLTVGRYRHTAVATSDGRVLIYGGRTDNGQPAPPELYDHATGTFSVLAAPENSVRANHAAVKTIDGDIWIVGGDDNTNVSALTSVIRFDHTLRTLSHASDLAIPRTLLCATLLADSRVLVAGGVTYSTLSQVTDSSELIMTATALRSAGPQMTTARHSYTMTTLSNGKVLIVGGQDQSGNPLAAAEIYE
jgi:hypothetical protein